jgi:competence protein ComEC
LFVLLTAIFFVLFGMINTERIKPINNKGHYIKKYQKGNTISIKLLEELNHTGYYYRYIGEIQSVEGYRTEGKIMMRLAKKVQLKALHYDDLIITCEPLKEIQASMNPGSFDFKTYAKKKNIRQQLDLRSPNFIIRKKTSRGLKVRALRFREDIIKSLDKHEFSKDEFSVIIALLLGKRQELSKGLIDDYKNAGAMHILAISGLHIGIILMMLNFIFRPLEYVKQGRRIKMIVLLICLWCFAFITGLSASVLRAVCMFTALTLGLFSNRSSNIGNYLFLSIFILLCVHPLYVFDVGFQLSYVSVFAIIGISPLIKRFWKPKLKIASYFWKLLVISFAAQIGIIPLSLFYFHQFSGLFFASSLVIIPFMGIILGFGFLMILMDQVNFMPIIFIRCYDFMIRSMNDFVGLLSNHHNLIFDHIYFSLLLVFLAYGLIYSLCKYIGNTSIKNLMFLLGAIIIFQGTLLWEKVKTQVSSEFVVFHHTMHSTIVERNGSKLTIKSTLKPDDPKLARIIEPYQHQFYQIKVVDGSAIENLINAGKKRILIIDDETMIQDFGFNPDIIVLKNAPKINLDRLLKRVHPEIVISDGSNFLSYSRYWRNSCKKFGIKFHDTFQNGAFVYAYAP